MTPTPLPAGSSGANWAGLSALAAVLSAAAALLAVWFARLRRVPVLSLIGQATGHATFTSPTQAHVSIELPFRNVGESPAVLSAQYGFRVRLSDLQASG